MKFLAMASICILVFCGCRKATEVAQIVTSKITGKGPGGLAPGEKPPITANTYNHDQVIAKRP